MSVRVYPLRGCIHEERRGGERRFEHGQLPGSRSGSSPAERFEMTGTTVAGFAASAVSSGVCGDGVLDLALVASVRNQPGDRRGRLVVSGVPCAGVFTSNRAAAAPVQVSRAHLAATRGRIAAVVLNSGNANAATGRKGREDAERTCEQVARCLGVAPEEVLVCSTGIIGIPLDIGRILGAVPALSAALTQEPGALDDAATAIMTTDTVAKKVRIEADGFAVAGIGKGAAMLAPNMATMLAVLTTDALVEPPQLSAALADAVGRSFNHLSIDGCTSTNDTVIAMASGMASGRAVGVGELADAFGAACASLARQMAFDAEGATKLVDVKVIGALSSSEALVAARRVADSLLVKCSLNGEDPYWGRVVSELGSAGVAFDIDRVSVSYGGVVVCAGGVAVDHDRGAVRLHMSGREVEILCDLGLGDGDAAVVSCDLGHGYIDENRGTS
ncbi:MAG: bifunctional glutamate N-acetyltransferase/amino-acid acetyltransferase ArgJ [Actinomycetota bacterium]|nr:bifunctional glutamate N-acetyltransferase/amino-acid acetyltransferase ArgJ [Actinomycetota bacterium]